MANCLLSLSFEMIYWTKVSMGLTNKGFPVFRWGDDAAVSAALILPSVQSQQRHPNNATGPFAMYRGRFFVDTPGSRITRMKTTTVAPSLRFLAAFSWVPCDISSFPSSPSPNTKFVVLKLYPESFPDCRLKAALRKHHVNVRRRPIRRMG